MFGRGNRELRALVKALDETGLERGEIVTYEEEDEMTVDGKSIRLIPAFRYFLNRDAEDPREGDKGTYRRYRDRN